MRTNFDQLKETNSTDAFSLQNRQLLKVRLDQVTIQAKMGSMVAYQGDVSFEHAGHGGVAKYLKKKVTNEGLSLMKVTGNGEVFLASNANYVHLVYLENDSITCNSNNILAFEGGIDWDIKKVSGGISGALASGLFNVRLEGTGWVALLSDGDPIQLDVAEAPTFADAQAAIVWSGGVTTSIKTDIKLKNLIGRGSGESLQMAFSGEGWVLVQPSEGGFHYPVGG